MAPSFDAVGPGSHGQAGYGAPSTAQTLTSLYVLLLWILFITVIVLLNMLIAMMNQRYNDLLEGDDHEPLALRAPRPPPRAHVEAHDRHRPHAPRQGRQHRPARRGVGARPRGEGPLLLQVRGLNPELLASNLALPRTKEADEIADRVLAVGSAETPVVVAAAAAAPAASADAMPSSSSRSSPRSGSRRRRRWWRRTPPPPLGRRRRSTARRRSGRRCCRRSSSRHRRRRRPQAALEQMYVALPLHQRRA